MLTYGSGSCDLVDLEHITSETVLSLASQHRTSTILRHLLDSGNRHLPKLRREPRTVGLLSWFDPFNDKGHGQSQWDINGGFHLH
jgi:hypothetical protein